jgi:hypothetical protein
MEARYALTDASDSAKPGYVLNRELTRMSRSHVELFVIISVVLSSAFLGGANVHSSRW